MKNSSNKSQEDLRAEFMLDMTQRLERFFLKAGLDDKKSSVFSERFALEFCKEWQGQHLYVPKNHSVKILLEHDRIRADFTGNNHNALAKKYSKHPRTIYKIIHCR